MKILEEREGGLGEEGKDVRRILAWKSQKRNVRIPNKRLVKEKGIMAQTQTTAY